MANKQIMMPATTLSAIKRLLFKEGGVDLSNIIKDLSGGILDENIVDLLPINVALVQAGAKPEIDTRSRYYYCRDGKMNRYDFKDYSLIFDRVTYKITVLEEQENGDYKEVRSLGFSQCSAYEWELFDVTAKSAE